MDGLDKFIRDLDKAISIIPQKTKKYRKDLFSLILFQIGRRTAYDNGVTRGIIQEVLISLGRADLSSQIQEDIYQFWKSLDERLKDSKDYFFQENEDGNITLVIEDYGFAKQQVYGIVSDKHPRQNPLVIPRQVDFVIDSVNLGQFHEIEESLDAFLDSLVETIEKGK